MNTVEDRVMNTVEDRVMSLCLEVGTLAILTESGWALLYGVMEYEDESLTLTVCWIIKVWSEYRIGRIFRSRKEKGFGVLCLLPNKKYSS